MKIIALSGRAGSGKSTAAEYLARAYGATVYSFAAPLKEIARLTLGFTRDQIYGTQAEKEAIDRRYGFSPRQFLQWLGTDGIRAVLGADFWVRIAIGRIESERPTLAVIEDARFKNEESAVHAAGGRVWRLVPPGESVGTDDPGTHASETGYLDMLVDAVLAPPRRDVALLYQLIDAECARLGIAKVSP